MANVTEIRQVVDSLILAFDKTSSPNDIIEAFDEALDEYETLILQYHQ
jgi:hypothetical protein